MSLIILGSLVHGFGWCLVIVVCAVCIAALYSDSLMMAIDYDGLDVEEISAIEEARAELAQKARERAEHARQSAHVARYEALAARAFYVPCWVAPWDLVALDRVRRASMTDLLNFQGVGQTRARRVVAEGDGLTLDSLRRILTRPVSQSVLVSV